MSEAPPGAADAASGAAPPAGARLLASVQAMSATLVAIFQTRLALLATEVEEEKQRLLAVLGWGAVAIMMGTVACVFLAGFITVLCWDTHPLLALGDPGFCWRLPVGCAPCQPGGASAGRHAGGLIGRIAGRSRCAEGRGRAWSRGGAMSEDHLRMAELALRKRLLQQRSAVLRHTLGAQIGQGVAPVLAGADRVVAAGQWLRRHPAVLIGAAAALLVWRPKGVIVGALGMAGRAMWLWQSWHKLQPLLARVHAQAMALRSEPEPALSRVRSAAEGADSADA